MRKYWLFFVLFCSFLLLADPDKEETSEERSQNNRILRAAEKGDQRVLNAYFIRYGNFGPELHAAAEMGWAHLIPNLVRYQWDVDVAGRAGYTPFMLAIRSGQLVAAQVIATTCMIDVDIRDADGATALHHAVRTGSFEALNLVLSQWPNPTIRDAAGRTAYDLLREFPQPLMMSLLHNFINGGVGPRWDLAESGVPLATVSVESPGVATSTSFGGAGTPARGAEVGVVGGAGGSGV